MSISSNQTSASENRVTVEQVRRWLQDLDSEAEVTFEKDGQPLEVWEAYPSSDGFTISFVEKEK